MSETYSIRDDAEKHWSYTEGVIRRALEIHCQDKLDEISYIIELCHYLYIEAMVHGFKHNEDLRRIISIREVTEEEREEMKNATTYG